MGGGEHRSTWCRPKRRPPESKWQEPVGKLPEDAEMVEWTRQAKAKRMAEFEGIPPLDALAQYDAAQVAAAARRARMTPRQRAAETDRVLDGIGTAKARMKAEDEAAAAVAAELAAAAAIEAAEQASCGVVVPIDQGRHPQRPQGRPAGSVGTERSADVADLATERTRRPPRPRMRVTFTDWID